MKLYTYTLLAGLSYGICSRTVDRGLNLPPTQGTTRDGAFFPGLFHYDYNPDQVARAAQTAGFQALRLGVNVETASNATYLRKYHKEYIDAVGGRGVICMFDTASTPGTSWPRTGTVTGKVEQVAQAWRTVHSVFEPYGNDILYEIFNEPWGYQNNAAAYVNDMRNVVHLAGLPEDRVILAGLYGSADVQSVARAGWPGYLAYHVYVFWLPDGQRTQQLYSQKIQQDLAGLSDRVFITEFGVGLDGLKANIDQDEVKQDVVRHLDQKSSTADWHAEQPEHLDVKSICAKYPDNDWCKKELALVQKPSANLGADVAAQLGLDADTVQKKAANLGADVAAQLGLDAGTVQKPAANLGADVAAQLGLDAGIATPPQSDVYQNDTMAFLRGMRDALMVLKRQGVGVRGLYHWHGWHNGDSWDFWDAANARSSRLIQMMMMDQGEGVAAEAHNEASDPFMNEDFVEDSQQVHMMLARSLGPEPSGECPEQCGAKHCQAGNPAQIGGKHLTGNFCTHNCSKVYGASRFCGAGVGYQEDDAIDCGGCASPRMCAGLPCWTQPPKAEKHKTGRFLQKRSQRIHPRL